MKISGYVANNFFINGNKKKEEANSNRAEKDVFCKSTNFGAMRILPDAKIIPSRLGILLQKNEVRRIFKLIDPVPLRIMSGQQQLPTTPFETADKILKHLLEKFELTSISKTKRDELTRIIKEFLYSQESNIKAEEIIETIKKPEIKEMPSLVVSSVQKNPTQRGFYSKRRPPEDSGVTIAAMERGSLSSGNNPHVLSRILQSAPVDSLSLQQKNLLMQYPKCFGSDIANKEIINHLISADISFDRMCKIICREQKEVENILRGKEDWNFKDIFRLSKACGKNLFAVFDKEGYMGKMDSPILFADTDRAYRIIISNLQKLKSSGNNSNNLPNNVFSEVTLPNLLLITKTYNVSLETLLKRNGKRTII